MGEVNGHDGLSHSFLRHPWKDTGIHSSGSCYLFAYDLEGDGGDSFMWVLTEGQGPVLGELPLQMICICLKAWADVVGEPAPLLKKLCFLLEMERLVARLFNYPFAEGWELWYGRSLGRRLGWKSRRQAGWRRGRAGVEGGLWDQTPCRTPRRTPRRPSNPTPTP